MEKAALMLVESWITILKLAITFWRHVIIGGMTFHGNGAVAQDTISCGITIKCIISMMSFALHPITITHVWTTTIMNGVQPMRANVRMY